MSSNKVECPYIDCGHFNEDLWELGMEDGDVEELWCGNCSRPFDISLSITYDFSRIELNKSNRCEECGTKLDLHGCLNCGAPVCCPKCCEKESES